MIAYSVSSLLETDAQVVLHGVNARGKFGAGVAKVMAESWPRAKADYLKAYAAGLIRLGAVVWSEVGSGRVVGHMVTQEDYGRIPGRVYVDYGAIEGCMRKVAAAASEGVPNTMLASGFSSIAMPKFGAGLAGGDWRRIEEIVEGECGHLDVTVHVVSPQEVPPWRRAPTP
jgi:O-acetyl-ADP-ribose deacetylase (regulator of RNase III)